MKKPDAFEIVETAESPPALQEAFARLKKEDGAADPDRLGRSLIRDALEQLTRQRSDAVSRLEDTQEEARREQRAFYLKLLTVVDSLDRLIRQTDPSNELAGSLEATRTQFLEVLDDQDIAVVEVRVGQPFDPAVCEVSGRKTREDLPPDTILSIERRGYIWQSKTLRRARVVISVPPTGG